MEALCLSYGLGPLTAPPTPLSGGYLHKVWRVNTQEGPFVIKALNPAIVKKPGMLERIERSERIGAAFSQEGIPAVVPIALNGRFTSLIGDRYYLLYPFVLGNLYNLNRVSHVQACHVAQLLARMHSLHLPIQKEIALHYDIVEEATWNELLAKCRMDGLPFADELEAHLPFFLHCNEQHAANLDELNGHLVLGHRDLHPENILWENGHTPHIIDWEYSGLLNPIQEITGAALEWSGLIMRNLDSDCFHAFIKAYKTAGGELTMDPMKGFYTFIANNLLSWTEINVNRALGLSSDSREEHAFATKMLGEIFKTLSYIEMNLDKIRQLLSSQ